MEKITFATDLIERPMGTEIALLKSRSGEFFTLSESASVIWQLLRNDSSLTTQELAEKLASTYELTNNEALFQLHTFIKELKDQKIIL